jgi:hypothetical protein
VLVPRSSGTPVATWAWPTWVVSRRRVLEAVFILLEFPSPARRIFIGSHSLPPSLVRRIGPSNPRQAIPNPRTYGEMASGTPGVQLDSTYRIAPANNMLQNVDGENPST